MFDDLNTKDNKNPFGGDKPAEDIFANTDKAPAQSAGPLPEAPLKPSALENPKPPADDADKPAPLTPVQPAGGNPLPAKKSGGWKKILIISAVVFLALVLIGMAALVYYQNFYEPKPDDSGDSNVIEQPDETNGDLPADDLTPDDTDLDQTGNPIIDDMFGPDDGMEDFEEGPVDDFWIDQENGETGLDEVMDSDNDGLTDAEEERLGTNINSDDSDNDGLTDRDELRVYNSDPLISDSDGDGYSDGDEVGNGYDPNGTGKLYELP